MRPYRRRAYQAPQILWADATCTWVISDPAPNSPGHRIGPVHRSVPGSPMFNAILELGLERERWEERRAVALATKRLRLGLGCAMVSVILTLTTIASRCS